MKKDKFREFVYLVARMKTEEEYGEDSPSNDDWIETLNNLIATARKIKNEEKSSVPAVPRKTRRKVSPKKGR